MNHHFHLNAEEILEETMLFVSVAFLLLAS